MGAGVPKAFLHPKASRSSQTGPHPARQQAGQLFLLIPVVRMRKWGLPCVTFLSHPAALKDSTGTSQVLTGPSPGSFLEVSEGLPGEKKEVNHRVWAHIPRVRNFQGAKWKAVSSRPHDLLGAV